MKKKTSEPTKKKGKKKKVVKKKETPVWGDPDCKSFLYHPVTGKPLNPFPNLKEQESIIPFFSDRVEQRRNELKFKKNEQEEDQTKSLYKPINFMSFGMTKESYEEEKQKPRMIMDLHRFEWMNKESWIRCRLRQKGWAYHDMFLNVQCSWTLLRLKLEIKKHLFEGSLLLDNILIYKNDISKQKQDIEDDKEEINNNDNSNDNSDDNNSNNNDETSNVIHSFNNSKSLLDMNNLDNNQKDDLLEIFSKDQECKEPLYKLFPRIRYLKSIGNMIPFNEGYAKCDDNEYPILVVGQHPIHIYEPPPPPPPPEKKEVKKKKKGTGTKKKASTLTKPKKVVKKKKKKEEEIPPPEEIDPNISQEPNDSELLDMKDENIQLYTEPNKILKNPDQYLYIFFDVNSPFVPSL